MARPVEPRAKLGWVLDGEFRCGPDGPCRGAAESLVVSLRGLGRVESLDEAACVVAVMLGESVDADPTNASLWGQFRAALADLRGVGVEDGDDGGVESLLVALGAADVRDAAER